MRREHPGLSPLRWVWRIVGPEGWLIELALLAWLTLASYFLSAESHLDWTGHALGRDFINYWTAGHLVLAGRVADIFQPPLFLAWEHRLFDPRLPFHFWSYPPTALFLVWPLGFTSYFVGFALWSAAGIAALIPAVQAWTGPRAAEPGGWTGDEWARWLIVLAPAVPTNIGLGQNGAFTAALMIGGLAVIDRRPTLAGILFGLLAFKPQIGLLLPIAVVAGRRWRVLAVAAATGIAVTLLSAPVFGLDAWRGFLGPTLHTQGLMLKQGHGPFQWMMPSPYMAARVLAHVHWPEAATTQAPFTALACLLVWLSWRADRPNPAPMALKSAVLMSATFIATPQAFNYDMIPAAAAALLLWRRDPVAWLGPPLAMVVWALPPVMAAWAMPDIMKGPQFVLAGVAPLVLTAMTLRLWWLCDQAPRRAARRARKASTAGEPASNT